MISKKSTNSTYDAYYDFPDVTNVSEDSDAYYDLPDVTNVTEEIDQGEYVTELKNTTTFLPYEILVSENRKPGHKQSESGVYDELDYELSPRIEGSSSASTIRNNKLECLKNVKKTKVYVISIVVIILTVAIAIGIVFHSQSRYYYHLILFEHIVIINCER